MRFAFLSRFVGFVVVFALSLARGGLDGRLERAEFLPNAFEAPIAADASFEESLEEPLEEPFAASPGGGLSKNARPPRGDTTLAVPTRSAHSSTLVAKPGGGFLCAWFGGTREGARDVAIYCADLSPSGEASAPRVVLDRARLQNDVGRSARKLGNPVLFASSGRIWLFVVSVAYGGWSGSSINYSFSDDEGRTWARFRRLRTTPTFNISSLVRTPCVPLADGGFLLPAYSETAVKYGLALRFDKAGKFVDRTKIPIAGNRTGLQPSIVPTSAGAATAFLRVVEGGVGVSRSTDGGASWRAASDLPLPNADSSLAAVRLPSGRFLLIDDDPAFERRSRLGVWRSTDDSAERWEYLGALEDERGSEFSYPFVAIGPDGRVLVSYTWKRETIKIADLTARFRPSTAETSEAPPSETAEPSAAPVESTSTEPEPSESTAETPSSTFLSPSDAFGLAGCAFLIAGLLGSAFPRRRGRVVAAAVVAALLFVPLDAEGVSFAARFFAFWDVPSATTLALVAALLFRRRRAVRSERGADSADSAVDVRPGSARDGWARFVLVVAGAVLYASELNCFPFDAYRVGYSGVVAAAVALVAAFAGGRGTAAVALAALLGFALGLYSNFWDALLDFGVWFALVVWGVADVVRRFRARRAERASRAATAPVGGSDVV